MEARRMRSSTPPTPTQYPELRCVMFHAMTSSFLRHCCKTLPLVMCLLAHIGAADAWAQYEVSSWRDHFPYGAAMGLMVTQDEVVARTEYALFSVDTSTYEVRRQVKGTALNQGNPSAVAYDADRDQWVVGYGDGGIDLKSDFGTLNIPDLRIAQIVGSKNIHSIEVFGNMAYLATAVGVVVVDLDQQEIADSWSLTPPSAPVEAYCIVAHEDLWLVGTEMGVLAAPRDNLFLANPSNWSPWSGAPDLGRVIGLRNYGGSWWMVTSAGQDALEADDLVWRRQGEGPWEIFEGWDPEGLPFGGMAVGPWILNGDESRTEGMLLASCCQAWGFDGQGGAIAIDNPLPGFAVVRDLACFQGDTSGRIWLASGVGGVVTWVPHPSETSVSTRTNRPDGPPTSRVRRLDCWNDNLWVATGAVSASWTPQYRSDGCFQFSDEEWSVPDLPESTNDIQGIKDILDVSIDPTDPSHVVFSSYEEGLVELRGGEVVRVLNAENSSLQTSLVGGTPRSAVGGIDFDRAGNLWFTNPWVSGALHVMLPDGSTVAMDLGDEGQNLLFSDVEVTRDGYVWAVLPRGDGVLVYDPSGTPGEPSDDRWTILTSQTGQGGLPSNFVFCLEEDLDNEIWVGTAEGPAVFYQSASVFDDDINASQILISQDGNLQYLLETEVIQSIIIDAGNRKWLGTQSSGVFVLSADGLTTDHHFTRENSPLPSNDIQDIAMDYASGEVYIATSTGLVSYRAEATNWDREMENVRVMPNPIRADHTGPIVFDGMALNSTVHITDATGQRIEVLESNGGRATWDGVMENGQPAPYGVYLAFATDSEGKKGAVIKFAILR